MKLLILLILTSCSSYFPQDQSAQIEQYCQDLNVLYQRLAVIKMNIANINTTRTQKGGPYKRLNVINCKKGICEIVEDMTSPLLKYEPNSPDANKSGYVAYPDININQEKNELEYVNRVLQAVQLSSPVPNNFFLKDSRAKDCFIKYPALKAALDYTEILGR